MLGLRPMRERRNYQLVMRRGRLVMVRNILDHYNLLEGDILTLESLLLSLIPKNEANKKENKNKLSLYDFKKNNLIKLEEDILYYCLSPRSLLNFKSILDDQKNYEFYNDIDSETFMSSQEERINIILSLKLNECSYSKKSKLSNYKNSFCANASLIENTYENNSKIVNSNLIRTKLDEYSYKIINELDENKLFEYLKEIQEIFINNIIDMESIGLVQFNFIENNILLLLNLILNKFEQSKDSKYLKEFPFICIKILKYFKSSKLYFYIIKYINQNIGKLNNSLNLELNEGDSIINFIPNNLIDIKSEKGLLIIDNIKKIPKILSFQKNEKWDTIHHWILNCDYILFIFILASKKTLFFLKYDFITNKIIQIDNLLLPKVTFMFGKNLNLSIKNGLIYLFYINSNKLCYEIYNAKDMSIVKKDIFELEQSFIPQKVFNDSKYVFCFSKSGKVLMIKRDYKLNKLQYIDCFIGLYNEDMKFVKVINTLDDDFSMSSSFCINNLFFVQKLNGEKYIVKFINYQNKEYRFNFYKLNENKFSDNISIQETFNDNRFIIVYIVNSNSLYLKYSSKILNGLLDDLKLLPFKYNIYNNIYTNDLYENLLKEYSSILNLCGNFDLVIEEIEQHLIKYPFSLCCNFEQNNLIFIIKIIIENAKLDKKKLYYIIIAKQIICCLFNGQIFNENDIKDLLNYFKNLIIFKIKEEVKEKSLFNKILKEIIIISSYIKNNQIIEINDIKFALASEYNIINNKTKLLLVELLLEQKVTKNQIELYEYIIQLEKNYLINIFKSLNKKEKENLDLSYYYLFKELMIKASEIFVIVSEKYKWELISLLQILSNCIQDICEVYQIIFEKINSDNPFDKISYLHNSFIFRCFYFIIEKLIANKKFLNEKENISAIYKALLSLDKISQNIKESDYYDMNNIIEITNYSLNINDSNYDFYSISNDIKIKMKNKIDIIINSNFSLEDFAEISLNDPSYQLQPEGPSQSKGVQQVNLDKFCNEYIYNDINEINIQFHNSYDINENNKVIKIIPIINKDRYNLFINNENYKIAFLIQKAIINYLIFLFEDLHIKIDEYNNDKIIKRQCVLYQTEIFKFMSLYENDPINNNNITASSPFIEKTKDLIDSLSKSFNDKGNSMNKFNDNITILFDEINKEKKLEKLNFISNYRNKTKNLNKLEIQKKKEKYFIDNCNKLFYIFKYNLSNKKNLLINKVSTNEQLDLLISKIFLFGIKYYNCNDKLNILIKEIEPFKNEEIKNNIEKIKSIKNYSLFYSFYEASCRMRLIYQQQKGGFSESNFEEDMKKYFEVNLEKIDFLYQNIISSENQNLEPNISIINNVLILLENKEIGINEIKIYSKVQNINSEIKLIELNIIDNLLLNLNCERNIIFLLYLVSKKIRNEYNKLNSFFENTYCVDYFIMEKLKYQFHLFLEVLSYKLIEIEDNSLMTKISLTENLLWNIRGRNFPVLIEIMKSFEEIKTSTICQNDDLFIFEHENIYNVKYFNKRKVIDTKFEVFKILVKQILNKIGDILKTNVKNENTFIIERNPSNINKSDYEEMFKIIISYFIDTKANSLYYYDLNLFFYKIFLNSYIFQKLLLSSYPESIAKIMNIAFNLENNRDKNDEKNSYENNKVILNRLIMLKLFCQIIEDIKDDELYDLINSIKLFEKGNINIENPFIYLYNLLSFSILNNKEEEIISFYYNKLLLICLNSIYHTAKNKNSISKLIENKLNLIILLLCRENTLYMAENDFIL